MGVPPVIIHLWDLPWKKPSKVMGVPPWLRKPPIWSIRIPWKLRAFSPECQRPRASGALWSKVRSEGRWGKRCGKPIGNAGKWSRMAMDDGFLKWIPQIIQSSWMTHDDAYCSTGPWWLGGDPPFVLKPLGILWPRDDISWVITMVAFGAPEEHDRTKLTWP